MKPGSISSSGPETMSYEYRGATANGLLLFLAAYGGGAIYFLHILDAASVRAFDEDCSTYSRLNLTSCARIFSVTVGRATSRFPEIPSAALRPANLGRPWRVLGDDRNANASMKRRGRQKRSAPQPTRRHRFRHRRRKDSY